MLPRVTALALIVLLCSSCGFKSEPTGALPAYPQTVRDALGRQVHIDTAPRRIVSLDPGMTAALYRIGAEKLLVGRSGLETYPKQSLHLPVMVTGGQPDLKQIQHAQADVVLVPQSMVPTAQDVDRLQLKAAAEVYVVGGNSVNQVENDIAAMGLITDHADAARSLAGAISTSVGRVKQSVAAETPTRTYVDVGLVTRRDVHDRPGEHDRRPGAAGKRHQRRLRGVALPAGDVRPDGGAGTRRVPVGAGSGRHAVGSAASTRPPARCRRS